jgi:dipeptidyl aminopeptidase/acylaminoacyl peptidase
VLPRVRALGRWSGVGLGGLLFIVLACVPAPGVAQDATRAKQIAEVEKQIAELNKKLADLKKAEAAPPARKTIELADILAWRRMMGASLSRDGRWLAYRVVPAEGNGEVIVRETQGEKEHKFPAGSGFGQLAFSHDSKWLAFTINPSRERQSQGRRRNPAAQAPAPTATGKVGLLNLATGAKVEFEGIRRFAFSGEAATTLALHRNPPAATPTTTARPAVPAAAPAQPATPSRSGGTDLILHELASGKEMTIGNVSQFAFDKKGQWLTLLIDTKDMVGNGVQLRNMKTRTLAQLDSGKAVYQGLAWTEKGDGFAVLKGVEDKAYKDKLFSVLAFTDLAAASPKLVTYDPQKDSNFPKGMAIQGGRAYLSDDLEAVFFTIHKPAKADATTRPGSGDPTRGPGRDGQGRLAAGPSAASTAREKPDVVIWHWRDDRLQSEQQVRARFDREDTYLCTYRIKDKKFLRLADDTVRQVTPAAGQRWAVGLDSRAYMRTGSLDGKRYQDIHVIELQTGTRRLALKRNRWYVGTSPKGTHLLYYDDGRFHTHEFATGKDYPLTTGPVPSFINVEDDHNVDRPPTRPIGWASDDSAVLISDNWDVWKLPVHGGEAINLTGNGKKDGIRYRGRLSLDPEEKGIDLSKPLYFSTYGEWTKKSGFVRLDPNSAAMTTLCWDDAEFGGLRKAAEADVFVFTRETNKDCPDYYVTNARFKSSRKVSNVNPQQEKYRWPSGTKLIDYKSAKGDRLQAALMLPADYEPGKTYPTIVYIYERLSLLLNRYPFPYANGFNPAVYASAGYAVLMPDIRYKVNDPGMSAVWCVLPALEAAVATGVVDKTRVGLHGHSWGGYQTSFLITQTDAFKAAAAGAPLTNLISMYSLIYWNSGWTNQPIFESSQGRFTSGYWDNQEAYIRNSPVFHAKKVKTPLLLLHNDKDGAVDFTQGIEYFNTLRRLEKPVVMLQYKGENHGLRKPANQKDYTRRMREFFDHHLRGKPAPEWLQKGVPHLKMDEHLTARGKE